MPSNPSWPTIEFGPLRKDIASHLVKSYGPTTSIVIIYADIDGPYVSKILKDFESPLNYPSRSHRLLFYRVHSAENQAEEDMAKEFQLWISVQCPSADQNVVIVALGGTLTGKLAQLVAITEDRVVHLAHVPTTLDAMLQCSTHFKAPVSQQSDGEDVSDSPRQSSRVHILLECLDNLTIREFSSGIAELIRIAIISCEREFDALETSAEVIMCALRKNPAPGKSRFEDVRELLEKRLLAGIRLKRSIACADSITSRSSGYWGLSIGGLLKSTSVPGILHGETTAIGMVKEAELSRHLGHLKCTATARITNCISSYGLPTSLTDFPMFRPTTDADLLANQLLSTIAQEATFDPSELVLLSDIGSSRHPEFAPISREDVGIVLAPSIEVYPQMPKSDHVICTPPGSKSISNRSLILAALGSGICRIKNLLHSDDTRVMLNALKQLGAATFSWEDGGETLVVIGQKGKVQACASPLFLANAGTASRFLTTVATLARPDVSDSTILTGNKWMKKRPIKDLVEALRGNGSSIEYLENKGSLPLKITAASTLNGGLMVLDAKTSSQYVSSILMCGPYALNPLTLKLVGGKPISQSFIDMTIEMMQSFGIIVERSTTEEHTYYIPRGHYVNPAEYNVESDASAATYPLAIAAMTGTSCTIPNIGSSSLQGDARFAMDVLRPMGCYVQQTQSSTTVCGPGDGQLRPLPNVDMEPMTDAFLTASVLAAVARGEGGAKHKTNIYGIANQRVKECNRIKAVMEGLAKFGVFSQDHPDGLEIHGVERSSLLPVSGEIDSYDDHRVAFSFSVLALVAAQPTIIQRKDCVGKTWPGWWDTCKQLYGFKIQGRRGEIS